MQIIPVEKRTHHPSAIVSPLLQLKHVEKQYQIGTQTIKALQGIDLSVMSGDFIALAGPSGSGKSTLLNLMMLVDLPSNGTLEYKGLNVKCLSDSSMAIFRNKKIGIVFQNYNLIPVYNALENVAFPLQIQSISKEECYRRAKALLTEVGLGDHLLHRPSQLSGGQRQRVAIARALVTNPELVIADEPTAALDSETGQEIIALMKKLNGCKHTTFIFSTHDPRIIENVDQVIQIRDGRLLK